MVAPFAPFTDDSDDCPTIRPPFPPIGPSVTMTPQSVRADDETTWPSTLVGRLDPLLPALRLHEQVRRAIDRRAVKDVLLRVRRPPNPHAYARAQALATCETLIAGHRLIGYHCTRLHATEVPSVLRDGLRPLEAGDLGRRIHTLASLGAVARSVTERMLSKHLAHDDNRRGMSWFVFSRRLLEGESGVWRLFFHWGGEALYAAHERDAEVTAALQGIGTACIVEAAVPVEQIRSGDSIGARLLRAYLARRRISDGHDPLFEGHTTQRVPVLRVIQRADPQFKKLTRCHRWIEAPT